MTDGTGRKRWHLGRAFLAGAVVGVVGGAVVSWIDYGAFDIGYMFNYVLGGLFICGALAMAIAALINWRRRNPI